MNNFTQNDLDKRIKSIRCCIGDLGDIVRKDFLYGRKCALQNLKKLQLLQGYFKAVCDYQIISDEVLASGTVTLLNNTGSVQVKIGGRPVSEVIEVGASVSATAGLLTTSINSYQEDYDATQTLGTAEITIRGAAGTGSEPNDLPITLTTTGTITYDSENSSMEMSGGVDEIIDGDNCLSESEMQLVFEKASQICDTCFKNSEYTYS